MKIISKQQLLNFLLVFLPLVIFAQVGIGTTTPHASSILDMTSTTTGMLVPRMTQAQRDGIASPTEGLLIYQLDNAVGFYYYRAGVWTPFGGSDNDWTMHANGTDMFNANSGNVGVGTVAPTTKFHVEGTTSGSVLLNQDFESGLGAFTTGGNANWATQTTNVNTGSNAAGSGGIADGQSSFMERTITIPAGGATLSFYYEVSSEANYDFLRFYIDGVQQNEWSGTVAYAEQIHTLTAGTQTLRWEYSKDAACCDAGSDAAYIDDVRIYTTAPPVMRLVDGNQGANKVLMSDANGNATWQTLTATSLPTVPNIIDFQRMEIPVCNSVLVGGTGSFNVVVRGVNTTVSWEVLVRQTSVGSVSGGNLVAPFTPERLQVRYNFVPALPFTPSGMILTANNTSSFPDTFSLNYANKSANSITVNITRTDSFGNQSSDCWQGQFYFDVLMTE